VANIFLGAQSNRPGSSLIPIIDTEPPTTGWHYMGYDISSPSFDKLYSGPRGTQGARLAGATPQNRQLTWNLMAVGSNHDALEALLSQLWDLDDELRRYGGTLQWRPHGGSFLMYADILDSSVAIDWSAANAQALYTLQARAYVNWAIIVPPFFEGAPLDVFDDFGTDTTGNYTFDAGVLADVSVSGTNLNPAGTMSTERRLIHTARGYSYGDSEVEVFYKVGTTLSGFKAGAVLKRLDASNYLEVYVDDNGTNSRLRLDKVVAGSRTNLSTVNLSVRLATSSTYTLRGRIEGNIVYREHFATGGSPVGPADTPSQTANSTLAGGDASQFGVGVSGKNGFSWIPQQSSSFITNFNNLAFVSKGVVLPARIDYTGNIPGDAPALGTFSVSFNSLNSIYWALLGWAAPLSANAPLGLKEAEGAAPAVGWVSTADANYHGGTGLKLTTSGAATTSATFTIAPDQAIPDDYRDNEVDVEVWGRFELASTLVSPQIRVSAAAVAHIYTSEYGTAYKTLVKPSTGTAFRFVRLGTLTLPTYATGFSLLVEGQVSASSTGQFGFDYLFLCLANKRALGATAKPLSLLTTPAFYNGSAGSGTRLILSDLAGRYRSGAGTNSSPSPGLGGALIELDPGNVSVVAKTSSLIPDDPTINTSTERLADTAAVQLGVTPRWRLARSS